MPLNKTSGADVTRAKPRADRQVRKSGRTTTAVKSKRETPAPRVATIEDAIALAVKSHRGQTDKYHLPYILHVLGVASRCRTVEEKTVAFLHDVVEDGHATFAQLRRLGFSERVIAAVDCLSRRKGETYDHFVDRIAPNPLARIVKLADLEDNMDVRRSDRAMKPKDAERMEKYRRAWQKIAALVGDATPPATAPAPASSTSETAPGRKTAGNATVSKKTPGKKTIDS